MSEQTPSPPSLLDDDQLNDAERAFIEIFERGRKGTFDDGALASAETEPEDGTPGSTSATAAPDAPVTPVEGQEGASETSPSPTPSTPAEPASTPVEGEPPPPEPAQSGSVFTFAGQQYDEQQLQRAIQVHNWYNRLSDDHVRAIDALLSGQYNLVPSSQQPAAPATSPASSTPTPAPEEAGEWLDPRAEAEINRLRQQQAELTQTLQQFQEQFKSSVTPLVQSQQQVAHTQHLSAIDQGTASFKEQYHLDDTAVDEIQAAVVQAGVFPSLVTRNNGNIEAATKQALDLMFWSTPQFRDPYITAKNAAEQAELTQQQQDSNRKQQQLTALSSSGGSVPRREPVPQDRDGRFAAMVETIAASQNGQ